jgi:hypothetical protein
VYESSEAIASVDAERIRRLSQTQVRSWLWRNEPKTAMRTMPVVMLNVNAHDALELAAPYD